MSPKASWLLVNEILPRLRSSVPHAVRPVGAEDHAELIQDGVALAARMLVNAEENGKAVTAGNIAYYAVQHLKSGRRSVGYSSCDVHGSATKLSGRACTESLDHEVLCDSTVEYGPSLSDLISLDAEDPAQEAMRKLDWEAFLKTLDRRLRALVECMAEGKPLTSLAKRWRVSLSTVCSKKQELVGKLKEFFGEDLLEVVGERPGWCNDLHVTREWIACRHERCAGR